MSYLAKDLSPAQRLAIESLLGRHIAETEAIVIRAYEPSPPVSATQEAGRGRRGPPVNLGNNRGGLRCPRVPQKKAAMTGIKQHFAAIDRHAQPASQDEADDIFEEAMLSSRPGYRTHR